MKNKASESQIGGDHYKRFPIQPVEFIQKNGLSFLEGNVIKYTIRHKFKNGVEDINKAIHYLELIKEHEYPKKDMDSDFDSDEAGNRERFKRIGEIADILNDSEKKTYKQADNVYEVSESSPSQAPQVDLFKNKTLTGIGPKIKVIFHPTGAIYLRSIGEVIRPVCVCGEKLTPIVVSCAAKRVRECEKCGRKYTMEEYHG